MSRLLTFIIFLIIASSIYFGIHYFVYSVISQKLSLAPRILSTIRWFFWISGSSFLIGSLLSRYLPVHFIKVYGLYWFGIISFAFTFFLLGYIFILLMPAKAKLIAYISLILSLITPLIALYNQLRDPVVKTIEFSVNKSHFTGKSFSIIQLSDLHLSNSSSHKWLERIVKQTNQLEPDLVVITGDLLEEEIQDQDKFAGIFRNLKSRHGVLAITGNHEYYAGIENFMEFAQRANLKVLRNDHISIAEAVEIVGIEDDAAKNMGGQKPDMDAAFRGVDPNRLVIFLNHRPTLFQEAMARGTDLQLSGHTHNGQIFPYNLIVSAIFKYSYGLYREGDSYIYTSSGTSLWGPPMRLPGRSEIVKITIIKK